MRIRLLCLLLVGVLLVAAGCDSLQIEAGFKPSTATPRPVGVVPTSIPTAVPVPSTVPPTTAPTLPPVGATARPTAAATAQPTAGPVAPDTDAPVQAVLDYVKAINDKSYGQAYKSWMGDGTASGQTLDQFTRGFADTVQVTAQMGAPTVQIVGANAFVTVPTTLMSVVNDANAQRVRHYQGTYTLEMSGGAWRIESASLAEVAGDGTAPKDRSDPNMLLQNYVDAINRHEFARAYTYWANLGANSGQTFAQFHQGFNKTGQVAIQLGQYQSQGAAGSIYAEVPAIIVATQTDGSKETYCGTYTLRRLNVPPFDQFGWRIEQAGMVSVAPVQLGSAQAAAMLANSCKP